MSPPTSLTPQTLKLFSLLPVSPLSRSAARSFFPFPTLTFSPKPFFVPSSCLSSSARFSSQNQQDHHQYRYEDDDDEEHVIGDCVVFEQGIFEDPNLQQNFDSATDNFQKRKSSIEIEPEDLIPEEWKKAQAEINITKKERRKIAQQLEFGRRVEKRKKGLVPLRSESASAEEYVAYRDAKLSQLKPLVLDNPSFPVNDAKDAGESREGGASCSTGGRVTSRNPRLAVYGGNLDDISEFFNSGKYNPNAATQKSEGKFVAIDGEFGHLVSVS